MLVLSMSPSNLSLTGPLTTEIYYWIVIAGNTRHTQTDKTDRQTHRMNLILSMYRIKGRVKRKFNLFQVPTHGSVFWRNTKTRCFKSSRLCRQP